MHHFTRAVLTGLSALAAAVATTSVTAHALDRTESLAPVPAGRGYVYWVKEVDNDHQPIAGRTVTMTVQHGAGSDATVAPSDANGHATGQPGQTASELSGSDGLAFFILKTSSTPGDNEFTWRDDTYSGQVVVVGQPLAGATAQAKAANTGKGSGAKAKGAGAGAAHVAGRAGLPGVAMPPLAAALLAFLVVLLVAPPALARRARALAAASSAGLAASRPAPSEAG